MTKSDHPDTNPDIHAFPGIAANLPCCFYIAEEKAPYRLLYANEEMMRLFDCRDLAELCHHTEGNTFHLFAMDDRLRVEQDIRHELAEKHDRFEHVQGHLFTRTSRIRYADVSGRRVDTEAYGPVFYCTMQEIDIPLPGVTIDRDIRDYVIRHLEEAIEKHWIQVYYQPIIRTLTGELCGLEALSRWVDPHIGFLSPASFIPVLEQVRLIHRLDAFVLEEVCRTLRQRLDESLPITPVSFNLSRYDFSLLDVFSLVEETRKRYAVPRDFLHIEITESVLAQNAETVHRVLDQLREEGYEIWLDDFGSGYSSLSILKDYTVDLVKLDMSFLRSFTEKSRSIIISIISMAKDLGVKTLAEGVETQEHADFLASIGCGRHQGYFYGKPRPLAGTLAHIEAEGRGIELRKWCHFYDMASMVIRQSKRPNAILDMQENGTIRFLYANQPYREQIQMLGYQLQDIQRNMSSPDKSDASRLFWTCIHQSRQSHQTESFFYVDGGHYISVSLCVIYALNHHLLIQLEFQNLSQNGIGLQQDKFDERLRYLYSMFENVYLVNFAKDTIEPLHFRDALTSAKDAETTAYDIRHAVQAFARQSVYEDDRKRYLAFCDPDTVIARIQKSPYGRIACRFRVRDQRGNYGWKECTAILLASGNMPLMLTATKTVDPPLLSPAAGETAPEGQLLPSLLWKNFERNTHFHYFWKDKERRFLGATRSFLEYYGFVSVQEIIGKTDEDMNWHVDNNTYRLDELDVLQKGRVVENVAGECIIRGALHHITCYKWPIYREGEIIGLMGVFFDANAIYRDLHKALPSPFDDPITGLRNRQGFLGDLTRYQETWTMEKQPYALILLESRFDEHIRESYENPLVRALVCQEAEILRRYAGKDAAIARIQNVTFAILRREVSHQESEALARELQHRLQSIHEISGNPVTITFCYSIVHADDPGIHRPPDSSVSYIYRLAMERLRHNG